jgi:anti-anti-sigma factor
MRWLNLVPSHPEATAPAPRPGHVAIEVTAGPETTTVCIRGELDLVTMPLLAEQLATILRDGPGRLVFDLAGTTFLDCGSARLIARAGPASGGQRSLICRSSPGVRRILELTGLDAYCEIEE